MVKILSLFTHLRDIGSMEEYEMRSKIFFRTYQEIGDWCNLCKEKKFPQFS